MAVSRRFIRNKRKRRKAKALKIRTDQGFTPTRIPARAEISD